MFCAEVLTEAKMGFFATIGVIVFFYYLISLILWLVRDSDIELFYKEKYGKPISKYFYFWLGYAVIVDHAVAYFAHFIAQSTLLLKCDFLQVR